jgi:hypothetical protein
MPEQQTFHIAMSTDMGVERREVRGVVIGYFGIDEREPGKFAITHIQTGNNLSRLAAASLTDAINAVALLNSRPDIWRNGRFGHDYSDSRAKWVVAMKAFARDNAEQIRLLLTEQIEAGS